MRRVSAWASLAALGGAAAAGIALADDRITPAPAFTAEDLTALPTSRRSEARTAAVVGSIDALFYA